MGASRPSKMLLSDLIDGHGAEDAVRPSTAPPCAVPPPLSLSTPVTRHPSRMASPTSGLRRAMSCPVSPRGKKTVAESREARVTTKAHGLLVPQHSDAFPSMHA